jgi:hypothetical protein
MASIVVCRRPGAAFAGLVVLSGAVLSVGAASASGGPAAPKPPSVCAAAGAVVSAALTVPCPDGPSPSVRLILSPEGTSRDEAGNPIEVNPAIETTVAQLPPWLLRQAGR